MTTVTITGADDSTPVDALIEVSRMYPFVEWGILLSNSRTGTPRYPSVECVESLKRSGLLLSAHLCGTIARTIMLGTAGAAYTLHPAEEFGRIQINGYVPGCASNLPGGRRDGYRVVEYILQARDEVMVAACSLDSVKSRSQCSILFDPSGGRGERAERWPRTLPGVRMGYAGGITPANVVDVLGEIREANRGQSAAWIDMESGVRDSCDRLDTAAVRAVLEAVLRVNMSDFQTEAPR